jgi:hypothetical protein
MRNFLIIIVLLFSTSSLLAQKYERSAGVRIGYSNAVFFDVENNNDLSTNRFMINWREGGKQFTAMKYFHQYKLNKLPAFLSFYYGYGIHAGYVKWDQYKVDTEHGYYWEKISAPVIGLDGLVGVSYDLSRIPVSLTCDIKPFFDFWGKSIFKTVPFDMAVTAVYHF